MLHRFVTPYKTTNRDDDIVYVTWDIKYKTEVLCRNSYDVYTVQVPTPKELIEERLYREKMEKMNREYDLFF
jgi:hypothetical protein